MSGACQVHYERDEQTAPMAHCCAALRLIGLPDPRTPLRVSQAESHETADGVRARRNLKPRKGQHPLRR
ncbi:hypothetical protein SKAU_G00307870 [Synaphobranchus kaupii]|uniref:Uncharacterized protein n=1 Tax=Synaphobranchus kaupii TaxID=118154 RepID=A0A9Q1ER86_SYNKA|nr:hypothetical protein SKAU_G00307870 [Synaphobranchus kaupii]